MFHHNKRYHKHEHGEGCNHDHNHDDHVHPTNQEFKKDKVKVFPSKEENQVTFANFINLFPTAELPISLTSETQRTMSEIQEPLSMVWASHFLLYPDETIDEFTEYMACFSLPKTDDFFGAIYWEANLHGNGYHLATFSKTGTLIDKVWLAGTKYTDKELLQSVCTIEEDWSMNIVEGRIDATTNQIDTSFEPNHTYFQLTLDGQIAEI